MNTETEFCGARRKCPALPPPRHKGRFLSSLRAHANALSGAKGGVWRVAVIGYARVSTQDQNLALQRDALREAGCAQIFEDHGLSAVGKVRPGFEAALAALSGFCKCIRNQIEDEERRFFPLIETRFTEQDWLNIEDEVSAYDETWRRLNSIHLTGRADIPFARPA